MSEHCRAFSLPKTAAALLTIVLVLPVTIASAQEPAAIDFARDVQPILRQHCVSCHGPSQQIAGLRLDRRRDALRGGTFGAVILPGSGETSRLYRKVAGNQVGPQMPPTGPMRSEDIATLKAWIDQGASWPDELAGDAPTAPPSPRAARLMDTLRAGDQPAFRRALAADPEAAKLAGTGGSTPLMYAALYGNADSVRLLLDRGAEPNVQNEAGATALMWAAGDLEKVRLLVERGANVNLRSHDGRTALMIAAARNGSSPVLELLLSRGAKPNEKAASLFGPTTALTEAAYVGDPDAMEMLIRRGADPKVSGFLALALALKADCTTCAEILLPTADRATLSMALVLSGAPFGDGSDMPWLIERGADVNAADPAGRSALALAAASQAAPAESVSLLLKQGADINATAKTGDTPISLARRHGHTAVVDMLTDAGALEKSAVVEQPKLMPSHAQSPEAAVARSLPLLQRTATAFSQKAGCVSCHNNTLTAMTVATARTSGLAVDEEAARTQVSVIAKFLDTWRDRAIQGLGIPGDADTVSYILHGLAAARYPADAATDAMAYYLKNRQLADGHWSILGHRPPIESSNIEVTAASIRALQVYAPAAHRESYEEAVQRAAAWLTKAEARNTEERVFRLLGLVWAGAKGDAIQNAVRDLLASQRADGSWSQLPTLDGDAYATGQALVALYESGRVSTTDAPYRKGVQFLLATQYEDGTWLVKTRAIPIQPPLEIGFPHGRDSWISAAATNWASTALALAARTPDTTVRTTGSPVTGQRSRAARGRSGAREQ
jgi:ankyrin repeat protein